MKTFEKYLRTATGLGFKDYNINDDQDTIRTQFADWIKKDKPSLALISISVSVMQRAGIYF